MIYSREFQLSFLISFFCLHYAGDGMNLSLKRCFKILLIVSILIIGLNIAFASDDVNGTSIEFNSSFESQIADANVNDTSLDFDSSFESQIADADVNQTESPSNLLKTYTQIELNGIDSYYKENTDLVGYLKDTNGTPIINKQLKVFLNGKIYNKTTDNNGKITLKINLNPNTYQVSVKFLGDDEFNSTESNALIKIKKAPLKIKTSNFNTYEHSNIYFKATVYNKITNNHVSGIRVVFKVYSSKNKKYTYYHATTNEKGIAILNKDLKAGSYKISTQIKDSKNKKYISFNNSNKKVTMKVMTTEEFGCCSFYLQVSTTESVAGFRRDSTAAVDIFIKNVKWYGKNAIKQYKTGYGYFFHSITTADGWSIGNGGIDEGNPCRTIEKLAADMVKSNKIKMSVLKKIQKIKRSLNFGHFSIKAPNGNYAVVYKDRIITGKLKPGEYISVPNDPNHFRRGSYLKFAKDPVKAAVKIGATDKFGVNRRDITVFHWKATSKNYKTTSQVKVFASNDNGDLVGRSTAYLRDNIKYKNKFFSSSDLPQSCNYILLGTHKFGNIDKLVKTVTIITAPKVSYKFNQTKYFKITVKNKKTKKVIKGIKIKVKIYNGNYTKYHTLKTDSKGIVKINTKWLLKGKYDVALFPANNKYLISGKSKIVIK